MRETKHGDNKLLTWYKLKVKDASIDKIKEIAKEKFKQINESDKDGEFKYSVVVKYKSESKPYGTGFSEYSDEIRLIYPYEYVDDDETIEYIILQVLV
jgi:hypothetical protein